MKHYLLLCLLAFSFVFSSCDDDSPFSYGPPAETILHDPSDFENPIEGLTIENYPVIDGSTSAESLNILIACKLLGLRYYTYFGPTDMGVAWYIFPHWEDTPENFFENRVLSSQTHQSLLNVIDGTADIAISARKMSEDEKAYANEAGVRLIETPIALDAFVFVKNKNNPVASLTIPQVQDIYTGKIRNWNKVGGRNRQINPYKRNENSGSQELMKELVMKDVEIPEWPFFSDIELSGMLMVFHTVERDVDGIAYTVYYYKEQMIRSQVVASFAINGIQPNKENIQNKSYPLTTEVYAVIRDDLDPSSMAYKVYEFLQTDAGKSIINESGYVTIPN